MAAWVYILKGARGNYYIGSTENIVERVKHHKKGYTPSTKKLSQVQLVFSQEYSTLSETRSVERKLKKLKRKDYIDNILHDGFIKIRP